MDGYTGARTDLGSGPSFDIADGAPTGANATNLIIDACQVVVVCRVRYSRSRW